MKPRLSSIPSRGTRRIVLFAAENARGKIRACGNSIDDASRLVAAGLVFARGAANLRHRSEDQEIAEAVIEWLQGHASEIQQQSSEARQSEYRKIDDLREAVDEAITEFNAAVKDTGASEVANAICDRVDRILSPPPAPTTPPTVPVLLGREPALGWNSPISPGWIIGISVGLVTIGLLLGALLSERRRP